MKFRLAAIALAFCAQAQAAAPLHVLDADVLAKGSCEVGGQWSRVNLGGGEHASLLRARGACGAFSGTEFGLEYDRSSFGGFRAQRFSLVGKTELLRPQGSGFGLAASYAIDGINSSFDSGLNYMGSRVGVAASQDLGAQHRLHGNLQLDIAKGGERSHAWGLGYEYAATSSLSLLAEWLGGEDSKPAAGLGLRFRASPVWDFGLMVNRDRSEPRSTIWTLSTRASF